MNDKSLTEVVKDRLLRNKDKYIIGVVCFIAGAALFRRRSIVISVNTGRPGQKS